MIKFTFDDNTGRLVAIKGITTKREMKEHFKKVCEVMENVWYKRLSIWKL